MGRAFTTLRRGREEVNYNFVVGLKLSPPPGRMFYNFPKSVTIDQVPVAKPKRAVLR